MKLTTILSSKDYNKFSIAEENRSIRKTNLTKKRKSMKKYGWIAACPAQVVIRNGRHVIIDGQHRFRIAEELGIPVVYVVVPDRVGLVISEINNAQEPWNSLDYVSSECKKGNPHFVKLADFAERHSLPIGISAKLLLGQSNRHTGTREIRDGTFTVKDNNADQIAQIVSRVRVIVKWAANTGFIDALSKACSINSFNPVQFIERCENNPGKLKLQPTTEAFLELIEEIYNFRTSDGKKLPVRFLASKVGKSAK